MKKVLFLLAALGAANVFSAPKYFTFTGKINFVVADLGGYAAAHNIKSGNTFTYTFVVDTAKIAYRKFKGDVKNLPDSVGEGTGYHADYFFDSLVTPSLFSAAVTDSASGEFMGYHVTKDFVGNITNTAAFQTIIGNPDHNTQVIIYIPNSTTTTFLPVVGTSCSVTEAYIDSAAASSSVSLTMTLAAISDTKPSNGVRSQGADGQAWMQTRFQGNTLILENHSGNMALATILDASGKTDRVLSIGTQASVPVATLPKGRVYLRVAAPGRHDLAMSRIVN